MEHESFEDPATAEMLNRDFVPVKLDREERPDVDRVYMTFVQATTGRRGLADERMADPGPAAVLRRHLLSTDAAARAAGVQGCAPAKLPEPGVRSGRTSKGRPGDCVSARRDRVAWHAAAGQVDASLLDETRRQFEQSFDPQRGGFGDAPKFPRPSELLFLLREHARTGEDRPAAMVLQTLRAMAIGGMRDHIGGGFHRYSVDGSWRVPHFEKMLYDQAQLVLAYLEASQAAGDPFFAQIAEDTLQYVAREMTDEAGGFYSAEDADSVPLEKVDLPDARKMEGAFYLWTTDEVRRLLGGASEAFERRFGLVPGGNAPFDPHAEFTGKNILYTARSIADIARDCRWSPARWPCS